MWQSVKKHPPKTTLFWIYLFSFRPQVLCQRTHTHTSTALTPHLTAIRGHNKITQKRIWAPNSFFPGTLQRCQRQDDPRKHQKKRREAEVQATRTATEVRDGGAFSAHPNPHETKPLDGQHTSTRWAGTRLGQQLTVFPRCNGGRNRRKASCTARCSNFTEYKVIRKENPTCHYVSYIPKNMVECAVTKWNLNRPKLNADVR